jgi:hypothetical protein
LQDKPEMTLFFLQLRRCHPSRKALRPGFQSGLKKYPEPTVNAKADESREIDAD